LLGFGSGRSISHSLLFVVLSFLIIYFISRKNKAISIPFIIGVISHLFLDLPEVPFFYPFIQYNYEILEEPFWFWITNFFNNPVVFSTEVIGLIVFVYIIFNNRLFKLKDVVDFLVIKNNKRVILNTE
jgi:hypothetical protein